MKYLAPFAVVFGIAVALPTVSVAQHLDVGPGGVSVGVNNGRDHDGDHHDRPVIIDQRSHDHDHDHDHPVVRVERGHDDHHDDHRDDHRRDRHD